MRADLKLETPLRYLAILAILRIVTFIERLFSEGCSIGGYKHKDVEKERKVKQVYNELNVKGEHEKDKMFGVP